MIDKIKELIVMHHNASFRQITQTETEGTLSLCNAMAFASIEANASYYNNININYFIIK